MKSELSAVIKVACNDPACGMISAWRVFGDGSFSRINEACGHSKIIPSRDQIIKIINNAKGANEKSRT